MEDMFLHPLSAGKYGNHFTFLGCKLKMMGIRLRFYKTFLRFNSTLRNKKRQRLNSTVRQNCAPKLRRKTTFYKFYILSLNMYLNETKPCKLSKSYVCEPIEIYMSMFSGMLTAQDSCKIFHPILRYNSTNRSKFALKSDMVNLVKSVE